MKRYRVVIAPEAAEVIRTLHPDLERSVRSALEAIGSAPSIGEPLRAELAGLWRYRVRRFRIIYAPDRSARLVRVVAVAPRRNVYEDLAASRTLDDRTADALSAAVSKVRKRPTGRVSELKNPWAG